MLSLQESVVLWNQEYNGSRADYGARRKAIRLFWRAYSAAGWHRLWATLTGHAAHLQDLAQAAQSAVVRSRHFEGESSVPISRIRGTEGRGADYDDNFRPTVSRDEPRWVDVATAWLVGESLPPVDLIRLGDTYFVRDGHHRVSIARALGQQDIEALVTVWE